MDISRRNVIGAGIAALLLSSPRRAISAPWDATAGATQATWTIFKDLYASAPPDQNIASSPIVLAAALLQPGLGTTGAAAQSLQQLFGATGLSLTQIGRGLTAKLLREIQPSITQASGDFNFDVQMWLSDRLRVDPSFLTAYTAAFGGEPVSDFNFADPRATDFINQWVSQTTKGEISKIFDDALPMNIDYVTAAATYFKAPWLAKFNPGLTKPMGFKSSEGEIQVPMMHRSDDEGKSQYYAAERYVYAAIPFKGGAEFFIIRPNDGITLSETVQNVDAIWGEIQSQRLGFSGVGIFLPRMTISGGGDLTDALSHGLLNPMFIPYGRPSEFEKIADGARPIGKLLEKVRFTVNEDGAEAASAAAGFSYRSFIINPEIRVDRDCIVGIAAGGLPIFTVALRNPQLG